MQLSPPTNIKEDDVAHYIVDYNLGSTMLRSTSYEFRISNCSIELEIEISAVSRCGSLGDYITEVVPLLPPDESAIAEGMYMTL